MGNNSCAYSERADRRHSWVFDGDDPYVICAYCEQVRDALTDQIIKPGVRPVADFTVLDDGGVDLDELLEHLPPIKTEVEDE